MPQPPLNVLDIRPVRSRHVVAVVRAAVNRLDAGDSFVLVHDRDPEPLHRELKKDGLTVSWTVIERRRGAWHVRVSRPESDE